MKQLSKFVMTEEKIRIQDKIICYNSGTVSIISSMTKRTYKHIPKDTYGSLFNNIIFCES